MADNSSSSVVQNPLGIVGMIKDTNESYQVPGSWSHARNASKVTAVGDLSTLSNEASTFLCETISYTIIGAIHLFEDKWIIYSTDNTNSEIGYFDDSECSYTILAKDPCANNISCLNFNTRYLIKGAAKQNFDCTWSAYWADGNNPDRFITVDTTIPKIIDSQFVELCTDSAGNTQLGSNPPSSVFYPVNCISCVPTCQINCNAILLASLVDSPCVSISRSRSGGSLPNGSYLVVVAYSINEQRVTDYFPPSNVQSLFEHQNLAGSLDIKFTGLDTSHFSEFELVVVRNINQQTSAKRIGTYSTHTKEIFIDYINEALPSVPIEQIPLRTPIWEKSEAIYPVGDYLVRVAPTSKFDFNYQPLANRIQAKWISVEYPGDYYRKGGNVTSNMRDEIHAYFIRWVHDTGDRSSSFHIPGRALVPGRDDLPVPATDNITGTDTYWEAVNTALALSFPNRTLPDGGVVIAEGDMGYWQSSEVYPDNKPEVWNLSYWIPPNTLNAWPDAVAAYPNYDLCGKPIRHHKMPDNLTHPAVNHFHNYGTQSNPDARIRIIGVEFTNIRPPLDNNGIPIQGITGYEILRGSREGNKTVIAKGIINNMRTYNTINHPFSTSTFIPPDGLFQNYPYNDLGLDATLSSVQTSGGFSTTTSSVPLPPARTDIFTFHSPDTQFRHPFLGVNEMKLYGETTGQMKGNFSPVPDHPEEKLINDLAFIVAALIGVGSTMFAIRGQRVHRRRGPYVNNIGLWSDGQASYTAITGGTSPSSYNVPAVADTEAPTPSNTHATGASAKGAVNTAINSYLTQDKSGYGLLNLTNILFTGNDNQDLLAYQAMTMPGVVRPGINYSSQEMERQDSEYDQIPNSLKIINGIILASHYWTLGTDTALRLIQALVQYRQYAYRFLSEGYYSNIGQGNIPIKDHRRYKLFDLNYLDSNRQSFQDRDPAAAYKSLDINNLYRSQAVVLQTQTPVSPIYQSVVDNSYVKIGGHAGFSTPQAPLSRDISSFYSGLIQRIRNQYGQIDSIMQIPVSCPMSFTPNIDNSTPEIFGGDTYITRYSEKNTFFYFWDWLLGQPDGFEFNYKDRYMLTYPTYWADFTKYEAGEFLNSFPTINFPSSKAALDRNPVSNAIGTILGLKFGIYESYFYLFQSGVRDFFVESEVNTDLRDWGDVPEERYYDPYRYTNTFALFDPKIIKSGNFYKYDYSLSISRLFQNFISWGNIQPRDYNPFVAERCFVFRPNRVIYSLPQNLENKKDYWRVYLVNNYRDFYSKVSVIKPINKNGAVIFFQADSPIMFQGVDTLQTELGTKITLGDGGLFSQANQSVVNVDISMEYGSCQDRLSVINTPFGLFHICANQGKIFKLTDTLNDITYHGLKFWFKEYLPSWILKDFPSFDILDNPIAGIGCQSVYDNQIETVYFSKRDFRLKDQYRDVNGNPSQFTYIGNGLFQYTGLGIVIVPLGDPTFFQDASWTVSYDPKAEKGGWISYHDWHPDLNIPSKNNFLTTKGNTISRHNQRRDSFCEFYGVQYPHEIEFVATTQFNVNTLRSLEYYLECYKYAPGRLDRFHILDYNFQECIVYNTEQTTGLLDLILTPKNNPFGRLGYPILTLKPSFQVLYSKEEQKYRINTGLFDITRDRGEFPPFAQQMIWITDPNGYTRTLNPNNLFYGKSDLQRKKMRHYLNHVLLIRNPGTSAVPMQQMISKAVLSKELASLR